MTTNKAFTLALRYLSRSPKTVRQMRIYLDGKSIAPDQIDEIINRLLELNYLDDKEFACQFIDNRVRYKPKSLFALGYELRSKGVDPSIADELLIPYDDTELAISAIEGKKRQWLHLDQETVKKKLMNYLRYRGFDHGACTAAWERFKTWSWEKNSP